MRKITFNWAADSSDGSVPEADPVKAVTGYIVQGVTQPSNTTSPTDNYDIILREIIGSNGEYIDVMGGELENRDSVTVEQAVPCVDSTIIKRYVANEILCFKLTNNSKDEI